jgi:hypothetical protein
MSNEENGENENRKSKNSLGRTGMTRLSVDSSSSPDTGKRKDKHSSSTYDSLNSSFKKGKGEAISTNTDISIPPHSNEEEELYFWKNADKWNKVIFLYNFPLFFLFIFLLIFLYFLIF